MSYNPVISFGMTAVSAVLKAKCGSIGDRQQRELAIAALTLVGGDKSAREAVASFLQDVERQPVEAGHHLQNFLDEWLDRVSPRDAEAIAASAGGETLFAWQRRADLNG